MSDNTWNLNMGWDADFLRFIALNAIWPHFLGTKLLFYPIL